MANLKTLAVLLLLFTPKLHADVEPTWGPGLRIEPTGRPNPYEWNDEEFPEKVRAGKIHTLHYPVEVTEALLPKRPLQELLDSDFDSPIRRLIQSVFREISHFQNFEDVFRYLGLARFQDVLQAPITSPYGVPPPPTPGLRLGASVRTREGAQGLTISCAGCHAGTLFGRVIFGLSNRFPRENEFFYKGKKTATLVAPFLFQWGLGASSEETEMYRRLRDALEKVETRVPEALGLDASLSQVGRSLLVRSGRPEDRRLAQHFLEGTDSKPAPWWTAKYKTRWLLDGSVISGNPIFTNFIWNEIGRGTDLARLGNWLNSNPETIRELTTAVFSAEPPRYTDFFDSESIDVVRARRGEIHFRNACAQCHGEYEKDWNEGLQTTRVLYFAETRSIDVGTDPLRAQGMRELAPLLNGLELSIQNGIVIEPQAGYVPPPLVGIFSRFPYFHNNSIPNLCVLLTREEERPREYDAGEPRDPAVHFDTDCVGYPIGSRTPSEWRNREETHFSAEKPGLSARGHSEGILIRQGRERFSADEKRDLIEFLKTL